MTLRSMIRHLVVVLLAVVLTIPAAGLAAQATPEAAAGNPFGRLGLPQLDITITDTAFEGVPSELEAGRYVLAVTSATSTPFPEGAEFVQMTDELTTAEFLDYVATPVPPTEGIHLPQPWYYEITHTGGPYVLPGETRYAVIDLTAGDWVFTAEYRVAPQAPVPVTVSGALPDDLPSPEANVMVKMSEFAFSHSGPIASGPQILEITNTGDLPHFYSLAAWPEGTTVEDLRAFVEADFAEFSGMVATPVTTGPLVDVTFADIEEVFGTASQSGGVTTWYAIDLEPGTYGALCFEIDPETEMPHTVLGQVEVFVVE